MGLLTVVRANSVRSSGSDVLGTELASFRQQATIAQQIRQATTDLEILLVGRSKSALIERLAPKSWCVAECLDHLAQTTRAFLPAMAAAIAAAPKLERNRRLRTGILPHLFIQNLNPPYRIRFKVLPQLTPQNPDPELAWSRFVDSQVQLLALVNSTTGLAIDRVRIQSPVYGRISYNIYAALRMLAAHQSRHVWQVSQILKAFDNRNTPGVA